MTEGAEGALWLDVVLKGFHSLMDVLMDTAKI